MQPTRSIYYARDATRLQGKGSVLKLALHVALAKVPQIAALAGTATVRLGDGEVLQGRLAAVDALLVVLDNLLCVFLRARDRRL